MGTFFGLFASVVFTILVTAVMLRMRAPKRDSEMSLLHNTAFWMYLGNWIKVLMSIARVPVSYLDILPPDLITLSFNSAGSLLVSLSTVSPAHLFTHYQSQQGRFTHIRNSTRFKQCVWVVLFYICAFTFTIACLETNRTSLTRALFVWRVWYFCNVAIEMCFLCGCLVHVLRALKRSVIRGTKESRSSIKIKHASVQLKHLLLITLYMRVGICATILIKFFDILNHDLQVCMHMFFIFTGLFLFDLHKRFMHDALTSKQSSAASTSSATTTRRTRRSTNPFDAPRMFSSLGRFLFKDRSPSFSSFQRSRCPSPGAFTATRHSESLSHPRSLNVSVTPAFARRRSVGVGDKPVKHEMTNPSSFTTTTTTTTTTTKTTTTCSTPTWNSQKQQKRSHIDATVAAPSSNQQSFDTPHQHESIACDSKATTTSSSSSSMPTSSSTTTAAAAAEAIIASTSVPIHQTPTHGNTMPIGPCSQCAGALCCCNVDISTNLTFHNNDDNGKENDINSDLSDFTSVNHHHHALQKIQQQQHQQQHRHQSPAKQQLDHQQHSLDHHHSFTYYSEPSNSDTEIDNCCAEARGGKFKFEKLQQQQQQQQQLHITENFDGNNNHDQPLHSKSDNELHPHHHDSSTESNNDTDDDTSVVHFDEYITSHHQSPRLLSSAVCSDSTSPSRATAENISSSVKRMLSFGKTQTTTPKTIAMTMTDNAAAATITASSVIKRQNRYSSPSPSNSGAVNQLELKFTTTTTTTTSRTGSVTKSKSTPTSSTSSATTTSLLPCALSLPPTAKFKHVQEQQQQRQQTQIHIQTQIQTQTQTQTPQGNNGHQSRLFLSAMQQSSVPGVDSDNNNNNNCNTNNDNDGYNNNSDNDDGDTNYYNNNDIEGSNSNNRNNSGDSNNNIQQ